MLQLGDDDVADAARWWSATVAALDAHPTAGVAHARFALIDDDGRDADGRRRTGSARRRRRWRPARTFVERSMRHGCRVCSSTALIRRAAVPDGGFREEDAPPFDFAFWLRMAERWDVAFVRRGRCAATAIHGQSFTSGLSDVTGTGYLQAEQTLREVHARQAPACGDAGPTRRRLERLADRALRRDIVCRVRERTLPDRPFVATVRGLGRRRAARAAAAAPSRTRGRCSRAASSGRGGVDG